MLTTHHTDKNKTFFLFHRKNYWRKSKHKKGRKRTFNSPFSLLHPRIGGEFGDDVDVFQTSDTGIPMLFLWTKLSYRG